MTRTPWTLLAALIVLAPVAGAQPGPVPGSDPVTHAQGYAAAHAGNATRDPVGHAGSLASADGAAGVAREAAFIACWAAYDAVGPGLQTVCAPFFSAPDRAGRAARQENGTETDASLNATLKGMQGVANTTLDAVNGTLADPAEARAQATRILEAVGGFLQTVAAAIVGVITGGTGLVLDAAVGGVAGAVGLVMDAVDLLLDGLGLAGQGTSLAANAIAAGLEAVIEAVATGISVVAETLQRGAGSAVAGAVALAQGIADAAVATGDALADAVGAVVDAVAQFFGHSAAASGPAKRLTDLEGGLPADDLLGLPGRLLPL